MSFSSYTWSFEKINLSMVLVVTGQLVGSYDEEFRRLYARSTLPAVLSRTLPSIPYLRDAVALQTQFSPNHRPMRPRGMNGSRSSQKDMFNNVAMLSRGLSVQERLHQFHYPDAENLVRGHSYAGELQKVNSMTRLRMGTKDLGVPFAPDRTGSNMRGGRDRLQTNRLSQQKLKHQIRYGTYQNLIPFNSETSLNRWKIDTYLNEREMYEASFEASSPMVSPHSSHTGLNEHQSQMIHSRSKDIKSRIEEMRQKRLSLQEYTSLRPSQESLKSLHSTLERPKFVSPTRGLETRQGMMNTQDGGNLDDSVSMTEGDEREQIFTDGQRSISHNNLKVAADQKKVPTYNWQESALSRTKSDADLETTDTALKHSSLHSSGLSLQYSRVMESLIEIPEEKEALNTHNNSLDSAFKGKREEVHTEKMNDPVEKSVKSSLPAEPQSQDQASHGSKMVNSIGLAASREGKKSTDCKGETSPNNLSASTGSQLSAETPIGQSEKRQTQQDELEFQRKNSMRTKVHSVHTGDEKKASKKEEKTIQRRTSLRSAADQSTSKDQAPGISRSQSSLSGLPKTEKQKSKFSRLSPQYSSKRKTNLTSEEEEGSWSTLDDERATVSQSKREKAYSRYEYLLSSDSSPSKTARAARAYASDKDKSSVTRRDTSNPMGQNPSGTDKLGRFMQRVGNLINKNK